MTFNPIQSDNSWGLGGKFTLSGNYGSLAYEGSVVRTYGDGKCMVRILELLLTFIPHTHVNRSSKINVKQVRLVATRKPATDEESWSIVGLAKHHLSVILSPQTPSFLLTKVVLELDEHDVFGAEHLGLAITDGKLLWPIGGELK